MEKLYIAMVGLPARGKSTLAVRLREGLSGHGINTRIFNNGNIRRDWLGASSTTADFYHPENEEGRKAREQIALHNIHLAREFFSKGGQVAILDATNASRARRELLAETLTDAPLLFIECVNDDPDLVAAGVTNKANLAEFSHLTHEQAVQSFMERIRYYERIMDPLETERCFIRLDSLSNSIISERLTLEIPYSILIRDILVSDWIKGLYLVRHGETYYNLATKIGGDSSLTVKGLEQATMLSRYFRQTEIPFIFTSSKKRSLETAAPLTTSHPEARHMIIEELDEIDAGICDGMTYEEIRRTMPEEYYKRSKDKYNYVYPRGEGYATMRDRVVRGFRKAVFLSGGRENIVMVGHQAINRMILSLFLFRRTEDVPYIFVPQDQFFHISATHRKKCFELKPYKASNHA